MCFLPIINITGMKPFEPGCSRLGGRSNHSSQLPPRPAPGVLMLNLGSPVVLLPDMDISSARRIFRLSSTGENQRPIPSIHPRQWQHQATALQIQQGLSSILRFSSLRGPDTVPKIIHCQEPYAHDVLESDYAPDKEGICECTKELTKPGMCLACTAPATIGETSSIALSNQPSLQLLRKSIYPRSIKCEITSNTSSDYSLHQSRS